MPAPTCPSPYDPTPAQPHWDHACPPPETKKKMVVTRVPDGDRVRGSVLGGLRKIFF